MQLTYFNRKIDNYINELLFVLIRKNIQINILFTTNFDFDLFLNLQLVNGLILPYDNNNSIRKTVSVI